MTKNQSDNTTQDRVAVVSVDGVALSAIQAEMLYKALAASVYQLAERVSYNRYDDEALANLTAVTEAANLIATAVPKKPKPKPAKKIDDSINE